MTGICCINPRVSRCTTAIALLLACLLMLVAAPTSASAAVAGSREYDWNTQDGLAGFGQEDNAGANSMKALNGKLYVGTENTIAPIKHQETMAGCMVYEYDPGKGNRAEWDTQWKKINTNGFGDPWNAVADSMEVYQGKLYVGTENYSFFDSASRGCAVMEYDPFRETPWVQINAGGFGDPWNRTATCMSVYEGRLYVGTYNEDPDPDHGGDTRGCQIWEYDPNRAVPWKQVNVGGFGLWGINKVESLVVYRGKLYVSGFCQHGVTPVEKAMVWRYEGGTEWKQVCEPGFKDFGELRNFTATSMAVYDDRLYAGTFFSKIDPGPTTNRGCQVWEYDPERNDPWLQVNQNGFGDKNNNPVTSMLVSGGRLYAGTWNNFRNGCGVFRYEGGGIWSQVNSSGFGTKYNLSAQSMAEFNNQLFVGTWNEDWDKDDQLCQIWWANPPASTWYLAEGTTAWGFSTYISIENANSTSVTARLTYMDPNAPQNGMGIIRERNISLPPMSQTTVDPRVDIGNTDFSTKIDCLEGQSIAVDRTMMWNGEGAPCPEAHNSVGTTAPSNTWFLPEGSSDHGFETWTLVQNPNPVEAAITLTYMTEKEGPKVAEKKIPAYSRATYSMVADIGSFDASIEVASDVPVIAERSQYRNSRREGSCSIGSTSPAASYFLAEGSTAWGYSTYVLIQNPNDTQAEIAVTYLTPGGTVEMPPFSVPANSRRTVKVNDVEGVSSTDLSTTVRSDRPIIAERAMYWTGGPDSAEVCHDSIGVPFPHSSFYLPNGQSTAGWETWTLVANPNARAVTIEISYLPENGEKTISFTERIGPGSRSTYNMSGGGTSYTGFQGRASIMVQAQDEDLPVIVERSMYERGRGVGTDTVGTFLN